VVAIEGDLLILRTELGEMRITASSVTCTGPACPAVAEEGKLAIHVSQGVGLATMSEMIRDFAQDTGAAVEVLDAETDTRRVVRLSNADTGAETEITYFVGPSGFAALSGGTAQMSVQDVSVRREVGGLVSGPAVDALLTPAMTEYVFGGQGSLAPGATRVQTIAQMRAAIDRDRGAIGYVSANTTEDLKPVILRESCGLMTRPDLFTVKTNEYPMAYPIYAYQAPTGAGPSAGALLDWMTSQQAQDAIRTTGLVDTALERINLEDMGMMLIHSAAVEPDFSPTQYIEMLQVLRDAERLSVSFRFEPASTDLDGASTRELQKLGARMEAGEFAGLELLIVGFADSTGGAELNTRIAQQRALAVRNILVDTVTPETTSRLRMRPLSYGELLPVACNDEAAGRERNRRVEIWVKRIGVRGN